MNEQDISEMLYCEDCEDMVAVKTVTGIAADGEPKWETRCVVCGNILTED